MNCPYCSSEMEEGYIPSDRYSLKWFSRNEKSKFPLLNKRNYGFDRLIFHL